MAASRVLEAVRRSANGVDVGTRGGVQRSVRVYEREGGEVDPATADRVGRYMCLAIIASPRVFHQAETHMKWLGSVWSASGGGRYAVGWKIIALQQPVVCNSCDRLYQKDFLALLPHQISRSSGKKSFLFVQDSLRPLKQLPLLIKPCLLCVQENWPNALTDLIGSCLSK